MFSSVGTEMVEYQKLLGVLWWDRPPTTLLVLTLAFKTFFFVMTSVILMNMLIAMMTVRRRPFACLAMDSADSDLNRSCVRVAGSVR